MTSGGELRGADTLVRTLHDAVQALEDMSEAEHHAGELLTADGSRNSPRKTGNLANNHGYDVISSRLTVFAATAYAAYVHAHNPWLADTLATDEDKVVDLYLAGVDDALALVKGT